MQDFEKILYQAHANNVVDNNNKFNLPLNTIESFIEPHNKNGLILDIGAFVGSLVDSIFRRTWAKEVDIICFDALQANVATIAKKFASASVRTELFAVGKKTGTATFTVPKHSFIDQNSWGGRIVRSGMENILPNEIQTEVPATSLGDYLHDKGLSAPLFVKIDIQGGDMDAVLGMGKYLEKTPFLYVECQLKHKAHWSWIREIYNLGFDVCMDGFQFGVSEGLSKAEIDTLCTKIGISIDQYSSNGVIYGKSISMGKFLDFLVPNQEESRLFTYFQTDLMCANRNVPAAAEAMRKTIAPLG